ncbi:hypothetical protein BGZ61DRAFT_127923 [Ilyonectria robusta]|uniref:uncharacterized protein n=1 Tax=Ilyonectria robusta TaxID=1079257 RepID=UPI001E8EE2EC|nr:uncharacterized protein BGZ61DRAFT_127923 [Ilyonectria robusta]KAH8734684.1 hypothetical protein BGZ61DRAFT_127923 [Ilyonectria robusta]
MFRCTKTMLSLCSVWLISRLQRQSPFGLLLAADPVAATVTAVCLEYPPLQLMTKGADALGNCYSPPSFCGSF